MVADLDEASEVDREEEKARSVDGDEGLLLGSNVDGTDSATVEGGEEAPVVDEADAAMDTDEDEAISAEKPAEADSNAEDNGGVEEVLQVERLSPARIPSDPSLS